VGKRSYAGGALTLTAPPSQSCEGGGLGPLRHEPSGEAGSPQCSPILNAGAGPWVRPAGASVHQYRVRTAGACAWCQHVQQRVRSASAVRLRCAESARPARLGRPMTRTLTPIALPRRDSSRRGLSRGLSVTRTFCHADSLSRGLSVTRTPTTVTRTLTHRACPAAPPARRRSPSESPAAGGASGGCDGGS
jgi:hypothetical protein